MILTDKTLKVFKIRERETRVPAITIATFYLDRKGRKGMRFKKGK